MIPHLLHTHSSTLTVHCRFWAVAVVPYSWLANWHLSWGDGEGGLYSWVTFPSSGAEFRINCKVCRSVSRTMVNNTISFFPFFSNLDSPWFFATAGRKSVGYFTHGLKHCNWISLICVMFKLFPLSVLWSYIYDIPTDFFCTYFSSGNIELNVSVCSRM